VNEGELGKGLVRENPLFIYLLGLCPALAVSDLVSKALGMGAVVTVVLLLAGALVSLLRRLVPNRLHPIVTLVLIAALVSLVDLAMQAYSSMLRSQLGVYLQLTAVNCLILGRTQRFARNHSLSRAVLDALGMGAGFTLALSLMALVREVLGCGTITLFPVGPFHGVIRIQGLSRSPVRVMSLAAGALLLLGYVLAVVGWIRARRQRVSERSAG
jgi:electron transport complex protein RnfE